MQPKTCRPKQIRTRDAEPKQHFIIENLMKLLRKINQDMTKPLRIIQWNARGLYRSRLEEFKNQLRHHNPHIVLLSETHWKDEYKVKFSAYNSFYLNRASQGGGVAILIKKNIQATLLDFPPHENIEAVGATIRLSNKDIIEIASVYCPNVQCLHPKPTTGMQQST